MNPMDEAAAMTEASGLADSQERIDRAAQAIRGMTREMANETPRETRPLSEVLRQRTMEAPLQSLAIAFLLGAIVARRW